MSDEIKKPWLLIVEDDYENQSFMVMFFKRKFNVETCDSAETFYERIQIQNFDAMIMDISLRGDKDGLEITREIRSRNDELKDVVIVGLSAHAFQKDRENAMRAGVDEFLTKPVPNKALYAAVVDTLRKKKNIIVE